MKTSSMIRSLAILVAMIGMRISEASAASPPPMYGVSFQVFYNELSPYGDWVMDPQFGYVWVPFVEAGFQPYLTNGYWAMTEFGNTWVSNYAWGWAPFHYGRWFWNNFYGWAWVPDYEWGPAWVSWRTGGGYYGWAPLAPGFNFSVGFYAPAAHWVFIPQKRFRHPHFHRYCVPNYHARRIYNRTTVINNTYVYNNQTFYTGPSRREVERVTNSRVPVYQVRESARPGRTVVQQNSINVYRPEVRSARNSNEEARPSRSFTPEEYQERRQSGRSVSESRGASQPKQYENQRNAGIRDGNGQRGANDYERKENPRQEVSVPRYGSREASMPRTSQGRENTPTYEAPQRRQESAPSYSKPAHSRETQARPESRTQNAQPRQQPNPPRQQPQVEQKRNSAQNPRVYSGNQNGRQTQQNPPSQRGNSGSERSASESRGSKRGVN
ncbi:DUF6600 domain-containing protein [Mariniradius saccharolyticus]|nr:DUF6600 domain-containing protein [Mariniradius saccharolyticus]